MAFILKLPHKKSKGILILKHSEALFLNYKNPILQSYIQKLTELYIIGVHWGSYTEHNKEFNHVTFHLCGQGTVKFSSQITTNRIHLCSRNFIPSLFSPKPYLKQWDIINVSRPINVKKLDDFLNTIRLLFDKRSDVTVLLLCPDIENWKRRGVYTHLIRDYNRLFTTEEQKRFTLLIPKMINHSLFPLSPETLSFFYNSSKIFTLFTQEEGESRVIHEALSCGLPVVVRKTLRGGGRDYLDKTNSRQFSTLEEARDLFIELIDSPELISFDPKEIRKDIGEEYSSKKLIHELKTLFNFLNLNFEGEVDVTNLYKKLPSHTQNLPRKWTIPGQDDLKNSTSFLLFICSLLNYPLHKHERFYFHFYKFINSNVLFLLKIYKKFTNIAKEF